MTLKRETEVIPFLKNIRNVTSKCKPPSVTTVLSIAEILVNKKISIPILGNKDTSTRQPPYFRAEG